ncbi:phage major capsid protein [Candidatus Parcubacteria bacterium]|nr:phage major capsid protein [Candidatus Parcubacteria bacterium]
MDAELTKALGDLTKSNQALTETITAKFAVADPKAREQEKEALIEQVLAKMSEAGFRKADPLRKMQWAGGETKAVEGAEQVPFNKFLKAVLNKDMAFLEKVKAASGQSEGTNADGGFTVPVEYAAEIIKLERQNSIARSLARIFPMGSLTRLIPRELAKPTVYWTNEVTEPTLSKGTVEQITQTAKKLMAIIPFSDELLEDNNVSYDTFIAGVVAQEMGRAEDLVAFVGDVSGSSDPFNGVYFKSGVNAVTLGGATLKFTDIVNLLMAPRAPYRARGRFVLSTTALKKVMKLVDDQNRPLWIMPDAVGNPGRIYGKLYDESDQIPDTLGTTRANGTNTAILFGAWDGLWISPRGGYTVKASDSASDSAGKSAFTKDEMWFKFRRRQDISVANPEAFGKLTFPAA